MKLREFLEKSGSSMRAFSLKNRISRYSVQKYVAGAKPAPRQARKIFLATDGEVTYKDMGYSTPPKNPIKDL